MKRTRPALLASLGMSALVVCASCSGGHSSAPTTPAPVPSTPPTSSSSSPPPKPPHKQVAQKNPFTGIGPVPKGSTIAVKIDDTAPGRPQRGIDYADIVYVEAVEGGLTRLAAIFGSHKPIVGYVRSTRPSDPDLLLQFGKITEAYSGGAHDSLPRVHRSGIRSWSNDAGARFYFRVPRAKSSYINLALNLKKVDRVVRTPRPRNIGWTFNPSLKGLRLHRGNWLRTYVTGSYRFGTTVVFRYSSKLHKYIRFIDGRPQRAADGRLITARNVIVQSCRVVSHPRDTDVNGNPSQFTYTVGSGTVSVFRQGKRIYGTWTRHRLRDGTTLRTYTGKPLPLAPGNTWVILIRRGVPVLG